MKTRANNDQTTQPAPESRSVAAQGASSRRDKREGEEIVNRGRRTGKRTLPMAGLSGMAEAKGSRGGGLSTGKELPGRRPATGVDRRMSPRDNQNRVAILLAALRSAEAGKKQRSEVEVGSAAVEAATAAATAVEPATDAAAAAASDLFVFSPAPSQDMGALQAVPTAAEQELSREDIEEVAAPPPIPHPARAETLPFIPIPPGLQAEVDLNRGTVETAEAVATALPPPRGSAAASPADVAPARRPEQWFNRIFDDDYLATTPYLTAEVTLRDVAMIEEWLEPSTGSELLDLGCGAGRHALELAANGHAVTGFDLSAHLLDRARDAAQARGLRVNFVHGDFRDLPWAERFDGAFCLDSSFGYFEDEDNGKMIEAVHRALRPQGMLLLEVINRDYAIQELPARIWWEHAGCIVLEEVDFNFFTSRITNKRSLVFETGRHREEEISLRVYSLHELGALLQRVGFRVLEVSGHMAYRGRFFGNHSRCQILLAQKR